MKMAILSIIGLILFAAAVLMLLPVSEDMYSVTQYGIRIDKDVATVKCEICVNQGDRLSEASYVKNNGDYVLKIKKKYSRWQIVSHPMSGLERWSINIKSISPGKHKIYVGAIDDKRLLCEFECPQDNPQYYLSPKPYEMYVREYKSISHDLTAEEFYQAYWMSGGWEEIDKKIKR